MKRFVVFLVLVGLAVPGLADSTDIIRRDKALAEYWDAHLSRGEVWDTSGVDTVLVSDSLLMFDSVVVVGPYRDESAFLSWLPEKRDWFAVTVDFYAKKPIRFGWFGNPFPIAWDWSGREIIGRGETVFRYKLLADTVIVREKED